MSERRTGCARVHAGELDGADAGGEFVGLHHHVGPGCERACERVSGVDEVFGVSSDAEHLDPFAEDRAVAGGVVTDDDPRAHSGGAPGTSGRCGRPRPWPATLPGRSPATGLETKASASLRCMHKRRRSASVDYRRAIGGI